MRLNPFWDNAHSQQSRTTKPIWICQRTNRSNPPTLPIDNCAIYLCDQVPGAPVLALVNGLRCSRKSLNSPSEFLVGRWPSAARICLPTCMMISVKRSSDTFSPGGSLFFSTSSIFLSLMANVLYFNHGQLLGGLLVLIDLFPLLVALL
jgi:hypothetical protein